MTKVTRMRQLYFQMVSTRLLILLPLQLLLPHLAFHS